jgi:hypothetical protein
MEDIGGTGVSPASRFIIKCKGLSKGFNIELISAGLEPERWNKTFVLNSIRIRFAGGTGVA